MLALVTGRIEAALRQKLEFVLEENRGYRALLDRHFALAPLGFSLPTGVFHLVLEPAAPDHWRAVNVYQIQMAKTE